MGTKATTKRTSRIETLPLWQQFQRKCIHNNGVIELGPGMKRRTHCKAGYEYDAATDDDKRMACFTHDIHGGPQSCGVSCPGATFLTEEEAKEKEEKAHAGVRRYFEDINAGICPNHKQPITMRQVGRCVYADPCGCRLYQGTLPKK